MSTVHKPKILFLTSRFPYPLEKGDKLRAYYLIKGLSKYFEICLFAVHEHAPHEDWLKALTPYCAHIETAVISKRQSLLSLFRWSSLPFQVAWFYNKNVAKQIQIFSDKHKVDAVYCHLIRMAEYAKQLKVRPQILDYMDAFSKGMERIKNNGPWWLRIPAHLEWKRLTKYEHALFDLFDHKVIISSQDRELIPHPNKSLIEVLPNGVDFDYFKPLDMPKKYELLFNGNMSYPPNIASSIYTVEKILPIVKINFPTIKFLIAGANPVSRIKNLESNYITVSGWMEDIREAFATSKIMLAPMLISIGLQNKILQAMAMKIPCVISPMANNALGATHGKEVFVANSPEEYNEYITILLNDPTQYKCMAEAAHKFVHQHFNWETVANQLNKTVQQLIQDTDASS